MRLLISLIIALSLVIHANAEVDDSSRLVVAAVGDIMLGTDFPEDKLPDDRGQEQLAGAKALLQQADMALGNLEGVLMDGGKPKKGCAGSANCYLFRSPGSFARSLAEAGFTHMSLANNHARDFGDEGLASSMAALEGAGIGHSGAEGEIWTGDVKGLSVSFLGVSPFKGSWPMMEEDFLLPIIQQLADSCDILILSVHGGCEGAKAAHLTFEDEHCYGEDRGDVVAFARKAVDAGADLVLGHGPHVPRAMELVRGRLIAYSLGNFATFVGLNIEGINGQAPLLSVELDAAGRFLGGQIHSFFQTRPAGPRLDPDHRAARTIARLTAEDLADSGLVFLADGVIQADEAQDEADE
jgi:hypothetical protein